MKDKSGLYKVFLFVLLFYALAETIVVAQTEKQKQQETFKPVPGGKYTERELIRDDIEAAIKILTNYEEQPKWKKDLASQAFEVLSEKPDVSFADLVADKRFRDIRDSLNMKFPKYLLKTDKGIDDLKNLVLTYFKNGGFHVQFNVVDADTLKDAQLHPENYEDLIVRVSGYSAYFTRLGKDIQDDLIRRVEFTSY